MSPPITAQLTGNPFDPSRWLSDGEEVRDLDYAQNVIEAQKRRIEELENLVSHDELTGLCNRRGLIEILQKEQDRVTRGQSTGAVVVMIDLNNFKDINDFFGHDAGDLALRTLGNTLLSFIRSTDYAARVGGDEFVLLLSNTTPSQMAQRIRLLEQLLDSISFRANDRTITVSCAMGYASLDGTLSVTEQLKRADKRMYINKKVTKQSHSKVSRSKSDSASSSTTMRDDHPSSQIHA